jgi:hypothetical protein
VAVAVNGQAVTPVEAGGFLGVSRVWQANDKVEVAFPLFVQVSKLQDNQNAVAFSYGPIVLSAGLGTASMTTEGHGVQVLAATKPTGLQETIAINSGTTINAWISSIQTNLVQTAGKLEFNLKNTDSDGKLVFVPHYSRYKDRYGIYWKLSGAAGGTASTTVTCPTVTTGGDGGAGGGAGGSTGSGGTTGSTGAGGVIAGSGGRTGGGGTQGSGGVTGVGGVAAGGTQGSAGAGAAGGAGRGGAVGNSGGSSASTGNGGSGAVGSGGASVAGGNGGTSSSGAGGAGGAGGSSSPPIADTGNKGCSCNLGKTNATDSPMLGLLLGLGLVAWRRSRRR